MGFLAFWLGLIAALTIMACLLVASEHVIYVTGLA